MSTPKWEIPFADLGKVIEAVPRALVRVVKDVTEANTVLEQDLPKFVQLLSDAAVVVDDKFLNFQLDVTLGQEALALFASIKQQLGIKAAAAPIAAPAGAK
ncbi:MAG: hypothetical protein ACRD1Y_11235 [Terriglobales bacterium]